MRLRVNGGDAAELVDGGVVETYPPFYTFSVRNARPISWRPFSDTPPEAVYEWQGKAIPAALVTSQGPPLSCQVVDNGGRVVHDYGSDVHLQRSSSSCIMGNNQQSIDLGYYYVGRAVTCAGSEPQSVVFKYDATNHTLVPVSCEYRGSRTVAEEGPIDHFSSGRASLPW
jgi:hypothetical protein